MGPVIELWGVTKSFRDGRGERKVLGAVTMIVEPGELVAVMGSSGGGKSTLLGNCATGRSWAADRTRPGRRAEEPEQAPALKVPLFILVVLPAAARATNVVVARPRSWDPRAAV